MSPKRVGALILEHVIDQSETLGDLLARLESADQEGWRDIFDAQTGQPKPAVMTMVNDRLLSDSAVVQTPLSDGDQIAIRTVYGGGWFPILMQAVLASSCGLSKGRWMP
jgi:sulfur carrier protein ThiS